jgi:hypothetical protein
MVKVVLESSGSCGEEVFWNLRYYFLVSNFGGGDLHRNVWGIGSVSAVTFFKMVAGIEVKWSEVTRGKGGDKRRLLSEGNNNNYYVLTCSHLILEYAKGIVRLWSWFNLREMRSPTEGLACIHGTIIIVVSQVPSSQESCERKVSCLGIGIIMVL